MTEVTAEFKVSINGVAYPALSTRTVISEDVLSVMTQNQIELSALDFLREALIEERNNG